jgi:capsular polysaccharide transport system permease protein
LVTADESGEEQDARTPPQVPGRKGRVDDKRSAARDRRRAERRMEKLRARKAAAEAAARSGVPDGLGDLDDAEDIEDIDDVEDAVEADPASREPAATGIALRAETRPAERDIPEPPSLVPDDGRERPRAESVTPLARPLSPGLARVPGGRSPWFLLLTFLLLVCIPAGFAVHYLWWVAVDRYHSVVGFSVRSEEPVAATPELPIALPRGFTGALDADILYEFIRSQQLVTTLDAELDLRAIYNRHPEDWVFSFGEDLPIEDLVDHWRYMVDVHYDTSTALIEVTAHAFTPEDARAISAAILRESTALINSLSQAAREDAILYAERDLAEAEARLKEIRVALRTFRDRTQTADPAKDVEVQMGVIMALQQQLAEALIGRAELADFARPNDPRIADLDRRIRAVEAQIELEKSRLGTGGSETDTALADRIGTFEELTTDLEFAEAAYKQARAAFDLARIEARRQSRYLAAHIEPTLSEAPQYPQRWLLAALVIGGLVSVWGLAMLVWYNVGDRR